MTTQTLLPAEEVGRRGAALYESGIRSKVEPGNTGKFISININNGEYVIATEHLDAVHRLREINPDAVIYTVLIGYPAVAVLGGRLRPNSSTEQV